MVALDAKVNFNRSGETTSRHLLAARVEVPRDSMRRLDLKSSVKLCARIDKLAN
jgi:hypothetical protein